MPERAATNAASYTTRWDTIEPALTKEELGIRQSYIERDLIDCCNGLLCWPDHSDEGFSKQQLALFRAVLMAAAALQRPPLPAIEVVVGYCLTDETENRIFEWPAPEEAFSMRESTISITTVSAPSLPTGR